MENTLFSIFIFLSKGFKFFFEIINGFALRQESIFLFEKYPEENQRDNAKKKSEK